MTIEKIDQVTPELVAAFQCLLPQLHSPVHIPDAGELQAMLDSGSTTLLVARNDRGEICGALTLVVFSTPTGIHAWIEDVIVDSSARQQGFGKELTLAALMTARAEGVRTVNLTSRPERVAANRLYQSLGFKQRTTNVYLYDLSDLSP